MLVPVPVPVPGSSCVPLRERERERERVRKPCLIVRSYLGETDDHAAAGRKSDTEVPVPRVNLRFGAVACV